MTAITKQEIAALPVEFKLNGKSVVGRADETSFRRPSTTASTFRTCATRRGCARTATAAPAWWRSRASARSRPRAGARPGTAWKCSPTARAPSPARKWCWSCCSRTCRANHYTPASELESVGANAEGGPAALRAAHATQGRCFAPGDRGEPGCLHPVHALPAGLPRGAGERRDRLRVSGRAAKIVFDFDDPMGASSCVACGECVQACPTGALMPSTLAD